MFSLKPADRLREANQTKYLSNANDLEKAFNSYVVDNGGNLPTAFNTIAYGYYDICRQGQSGSCVSLDELVTSGKMSSIPVDSDTLTATTTGFKVKYDPTRKEVLVYSNAEYTSRVNSGTTLTEGLVGWWKMDEASWNGTSGEVIDSSEKSNNGTRGGNATTSSGKYANAGIYDGSGDYILVPGSNTLDLQDMTISSWNYATTYDSNMFMAEKTINGAVNSQFSLFYNSGGSNSQIYFRTIGLSPQDLAVTDHIDGPQINQWNHVVAIFEKNTGKKTIYVNGKQIATQTGITGSIPTDPMGTMWIGAYGGGVGYPFNGKIDETRIYNRALNSTEVLALYNYSPRPIAHWKFDESSSSIAQDSSGNGNIGTLVNVPSSVVGKYNNALAFVSSIPNYVRAPITINSKLDIRGSVTYSAWFKRNSTVGYQTLIDMLDSCGTADADGHFLRFYDTVLVFQAMINDISGPDPFSISYNNPSIFSDTSNWHHVAITWDGTPTLNSARMYIDGAMVSQTTPVASGSNMVSLVGGNLSVGILSCNAHAFNGYIDDVRIYNYARTQSQIIEDMNNL